MLYDLDWPVILMRVKFMPIQKMKIQPNQNLFL